MWTGLPARRSASDSTATDLRPKNSSGVCRNLGMYVEGHVFSLGEYSTSPTNSAFPRIFRCSNRGVTAKKLNSRPEAQPVQWMSQSSHVFPTTRSVEVWIFLRPEWQRCAKPLHVSAFRFHHVVGPTRDCGVCSSIWS